jgi:hypothetical protein
MKPLAERLSRLRSAPAASASADADLRQRLQKLSAGRAQRARDQALDEPQLAALLQAETVAEGVLRIERRMPLSAAATRTPPGPPGLKALAPASPLFIDTETTGLSGGSGTLAFLVGSARVERGELVVRQYLLTRFSGEQAMLQAFAAEVGETDCLVSYNGKSFDLPLLENRFRLAGLGNPLTTLPHLDLLHWVRRAYGSRWADCRLGRVERRLLDFERSDDLPGSEAPAAWFDWIRARRGERLPGVARHNRWDLRSLALLLPKLAQIYRDPIAQGADALALARFYLARGDRVLALRILERGERQLSSAGRMELARLLRREGRLQEARRIWTALAAQGLERAREQLAKYYEHTVGDLHAALAIAQELAVDAASRHRCRRLQRKLALEKVQPPRIAERS